MTPLALAPAVLFLLGLSPALDRAPGVRTLRPVMAALLMLSAGPWLRELAAQGTRAGLFAVPVLILGSALSQGRSWPRALIRDVLLGCASGLAALLLATGLSGAVDALWAWMAVRGLDEGATAAPHGLARGLSAGLGLAATFALLTTALSGAGDAPRGPAAIAHGTVVAAGLTATAAGAVQIVLFWTVLGVHALAADALASARARRRSAPADRILSLAAHLSVAVVTFASVEFLS